MHRDSEGPGNRAARKTSMNREGQADGQRAGKAQSQRWGGAKKKKAGRDKRQERWGHRRGLLTEGADTKKGTDFRAAVEEE